MYRIESGAVISDSYEKISEFGICLDLNNMFYVSEFYDGVVINHNTDSIRNRQNPIIQAYMQACEMLGFSFKGIRIDTNYLIPQFKGLSYDISLLTTGVTAAYLLNDRIPRKSDIFEICCELNPNKALIAANVFGNLQMAYRIDESNRTYQIEPSNDFYLTCIFDSTLKDNEVIEDIKDVDEAHNYFERTHLLMEAFKTGNKELMIEATKMGRTLLNEKHLEIMSICERIGSLGFFVSRDPSVMVCVSDDKGFTAKLANYFYTSGMIAKTMQVNYSDQGLSIFRGKN